MVLHLWASGRKFVNQGNPLNPRTMCPNEQWWFLITSIVTSLLIVSRLFCFCFSGTNLGFSVCLFVVQKTIELITRAKKPVVLVGSQATLPPVPVEQLRKALEVSNFVESWVKSPKLLLLCKHYSMNKLILREFTF